MIKDKDLRELRQTYCYRDGREVTLQRIQDAIREVSEQYQIPISFYNDQIKSGGMLNSQVTECLVLYHPDHRDDYFKIAISVRYEGTMAYVSTQDFGVSKNMKKLNAREVAVSALKQGSNDAKKEGNWSPGMSLMSGVIGGTVGALRSLGGSKAKQETENRYYASLMQILEEVIH